MLPEAIMIGCLVAVVSFIGILAFLAFTKNEAPVQPVVTDASVSEE